MKNDAVELLDKVVDRMVKDGFDRDVAEKLMLGLNAKTSYGFMKQAEAWARVCTNTYINVSNLQQVVSGSACANFDEESENFVITPKEKFN